MKSLRFTLLFSLLTMVTIAQTEVWYFGGLWGGNNGLSFTGPGNSPVQKNNGIKGFYEAISVLSDGSGNVKFYTDGIEVFDKGNALMPALAAYTSPTNGAGKLTGPNEPATISGSSINGVLVVNEPGSTTRFYILTVGETVSNNVNGFRYSILDMTLPGNGTVPSPKGNLVAGQIDKLVDAGNPMMSEAMAAYGSPCGDTTWIVVHARSGQNFYAYPLTSAGFGAPVTTTITPNLVNSVNNTRGSMDFTPDGKKIAFCMQNSGAGGAGAYIYDFNASTGVLSNMVSADVTSGWYGCEFSPDGNILYYNGANAAKMKRYILSTATVQTVENTGHFWGDIERGKDGKLYVGKHHAENSSSLAVIDDPNNLTLGSIGYNFNGFATNTTVSSGLPQMFINSGGAGSQVGVITDPASLNVCDNDAAFQIVAAPPGGVWSSSPSGFVNNSGMFDPGAGSGAGPWPVKVYYGNPPCMTTDSVTITVTVCCPPVSTNPIGDICPGDNLDLSAYVAQGTGNWSIVSGVGGSITGTTFKSNTAGAFTVRYTLNPLPGGGCTQYSEQSFNVKAAPTPNVADHTQCFGDPAWTFDAGAGYNPYSWVGPGAITGSSQTLLTSTAGKYTVTVTLNGCTGSDTAHLTITPLPVVTFVLADADACINEAAFALSGGSPSGGTYSGPGVSGGNFDPANAGGAGAKQLTYTLTASGCTDSAHATLNVHDLPVVTLDIPVATICIDAPAFALSGGSPLGGTYSGPGVSGGIFSPSSATAGTKTITYEYTDAFTCKNSATDTIKVNPLPTVTLTLPNSSVCIDLAPFALTGGSPVGGTYSGNGVSANTFDPMLGASPDTITYTYTDPTTTCTNSATDIIIINLLPVVSLQDTSVCPGGSGIILIPSPPSWSQYEWNTGATTATLNVSVPNTQYWVLVTDANGCKDTAFAFVSMGDTLHVDLGGPKDFCADQTVVLDAAKYGPFSAPVTYQWYGGISSTSTLTVTGSGLYGVLVMDGRGCIGGDTVSAAVHALPVVDVGPDTSVCFVGHEKYSFTLPNNYKTITWSTGQLGVKGILTVPGNLIVTVTNNFNCVAKDTAVITNYCKPTKLCFPNVMTPNNDGYNDLFKVCHDQMDSIWDGNYKGFMDNILSVDFIVYDRWGIRVFQSKNLLPVWDGNFQGLPASPGVYYWVVRYKDSSMAEYEQTGFVQLIRD